MDLLLVAAFAPFAICALPIIALCIKIDDGGSVFYISRRMKTAQHSFGLIKFRTMQDLSQDMGVTGADKTARITKTGSVLRKYRLDELPQLWNIAFGDISFVGPRPPLPEYVTRFPDIYARVLQSKPGLTGLATLIFHKNEAKLLAHATTPVDTDAIYARRCIPRKARLDLIYADNRNLGLDVWIILQTFKAVFTKAR